jgi:hypothetical protein
MLRSASHRFLARAFAFVAATACLLFAAPAAAQGVPGKNVTLVGPTPRPAGCQTPPYCGGLLPDVGLKQQNEPSAVISPETGNIMVGANDYRGADRKDGVLGDAWMGAYMSRDGGLTWVSRLAPGFKGDSASSTLGLAYGADPVLLAFPGGVLYVFIAGNRGENATGGVFAKQWVEVNKEDGYPFVPSTGAPRQIASGTAGRFLDKPGAMINMLGSGTCTIPYTRRDGTAGSRTVPAFEATVAYATFLGSAQSDGTAIWIVKSSDCGVTWSHPGDKVTQTLNINQGVSLTSLGNRYLAVWRTFTDSNQTQSALYYSLSTNRGQSWSKASLLTAIAPFDQGTSSVTFRSTALPWMVSDGNAFHVFWAERRSATDPLSHIKYVSSTNGNAWSVPAYVDNSATAIGHQLIPSASSANGVTQVAWYDTRDDHTQTFTQFINDFKDLAGDIHRHTADVRAAQAAWNGTSLVFAPSVKVSSYRVGLVPPGLPGGGTVRKLEDNFVNSRIFQQGTVPFLGDYIAVAAKVAPAGQQPTFFVAWTDNRSLRGNTIADLVAPTGYTPPTLSALQGEPDPTQDYGPCDPALANTRNQEVFGALIRPGLVVSVPSAAKPTSTIQRAYVVHVANNTAQAKNYKVQIANQPADAPPVGAGRASFVQDVLAPLVVTQCLTVPKRSGAATTVFVTSTSATPPSILVQVNEADSACLAVPGASASVTLNPAAPDMENPDFENPDFENFDLRTFEVHNPDLENRTVSSFTIASPDLENPDFENYTLAFPDMENPDFENPDFENFTVKYPDMENPDFENPDFENSAITEVTWSVTLKGNTTSAIDAKALFSHVPTTVTQLIVRRVYVTSTSQGCGLVNVATNQVIVNSVSQPGEQPSGSFFLAPGEVALVTVRMPGIVNPATIGANTTSQAGNTGSTAPSDEDPPVVDVTPPALTLPASVTAEATDSTGATVAYAATANDNTDGAVAVTCTPVSGSLFALGATTVTCTAVDSFGNTATGSFVVTVVDTTNPTLSGVPSSFQVEATGPSGATATWTGPSASDLVDGSLAVTCQSATHLTSGSTFPIGATLVTCSATDAHGNTATGTFTVTVSDTTAPVVGSHANLSAEATGASGAAVSYSNPTASDAVGVASMSCSPASDSTFALGTTTVTCTARDAANNAGSGTFTITVVDTTPPVIAAHAPVAATVTSAAGALVTYTKPTATDLVDGAVAVTCLPAPGSLFPAGATTVQCGASDAHGNAASSSFTVSVGYGFVGLLSPWKPSPLYTVNLGSAVPVSWQYTNAAGVVVATSTLQPTVTFTQLQSCNGAAETAVVYVNTATPGNSYFTYSSGTWKLNWQTKAPVAAGCYNVRVILSTTGQTNGPFLIKLK